MPDYSPIRPILSRMSMEDLWGMCDHWLARLRLLRSWTTCSALFGAHHWVGVPGGWVDQHGRVVMCVNPLNQTEPQYQRACPKCAGQEVPHA